MQGTQKKWNQTRTRNFRYKEIERANLFEGLPYVQYDAFVRRDKSMQYVVLRDLIKIVNDKLNTLKNVLLDKAKMNKIISQMKSANISAFNQRIEEIIVLVQSIGSILLQEYGKQPESIGIKESPVNKQKDELVKLDKEVKIYDQNVALFQEMLQYFKERVEVYMIMVRQPSYKIIDDEDCRNLLKDITALRYNILGICEDVRILDQTIDERMLMERNRSMKVFSKTAKSLIIEEDKTPADIQRERQLKLQQLMQNKFNYSKNNLQTRESKMILDQGKLEQEKILVLESSLKASKIKHVIADNRKKLAIEKLRDPRKDPSLKEALEIMSRVLNINVSEQFE